MGSETGIDTEEIGPWEVVSVQSLGGGEEVLNSNIATPAEARKHMLEWADILKDAYGVVVVVRPMKPRLAEPMINDAVPFDYRKAHTKEPPVFDHGPKTGLPLMGEANPVPDMVYPMEGEWHDSKGDALQLMRRIHSLVEAVATPPPPTTPANLRVQINARIVEVQQAFDKLREVLEDNLADMDSSFRLGTADLATILAPVDHALWLFQGAFLGGAPKGTHSDG